MAATIVTTDLADGAHLRDTPNGFVDTRGWIIKDVTGASGSERKFNAMQATGVARGTAHPFLPLVVCKSRDAKPIGKSGTQWKVTCEYSLIDVDDVPGEPPPDDVGPAQLSIRSGIQRVTTQKKLIDVPPPPPPPGQSSRDLTDPLTREQIVLGHKFHLAKDSNDLAKLSIGDAYRGGEVLDIVDFPEGAQPANVTHKDVFTQQAGEVEDDEIVSVLTFSRWELNNPAPKTKTYVNRVNEGGLIFSGVIIPLRSLLCTRLDGTFNPTIPAWRVEYEFVANWSHNWDQDVIYIDTTTGKPPKDVTVEPTPEPAPEDPPILYGLRRVKLKGEANFLDLQLTA